MVDPRKTRWPREGARPEDALLAMVQQFGPLFTSATAARAHGIS